MVQHLRNKFVLLDYIYIDGDIPSTKSCRFRMGISNCKEGTVIVLDDWDIQEVQDAIKYFCNKYSQSCFKRAQYPNIHSKIVIKNT